MSSRLLALLILLAGCGSLPDPIVLDHRGVFVAPAGAGVYITDDGRAVLIEADTAFVDTRWRDYFRERGR